jgi:signal transduction histidine kinase
VTGRDGAPSVHQSVFVRLIAVMVALAIVSLAMIASFYFFVLLPGLHASMDGFVRQHVRSIAEAMPDSTAARRLATTLEMDVRYEGPGGSWSTDPRLPSADSLQSGLAFRRNPHALLGRAYYITRAPQGGRYVFARSFGRHVYAAHTHMLLVLLVILIVVFGIAYFVLRNTLRPLRSLGEGVARLSEGDFDTVVPEHRGDEFGVLTRAFNRMTGRIKDMMRARDQLLLDVSHELRSPLTRLKVALEMQPPGTARASMQSDVAEMETMVTELLELERLRDGRGIQVTPVDLTELAREVVGGFADRPPGVLLEVNPVPVAIGVDRDRVRTVLRNVIENAVKYSLQDSRPVEVRVSETAAAVIVRVSDDGPGIPVEERARLFEPFHRVDRSRSRRTGGYGLGLSMCLRIMEAHGGGITVDDRSPRGAVFVLTFPKRTG